MKYLIGILLSFALFLPSAFAEKPDDELIAGRLWQLAALPAWHVLWVNIHEGSHTLTARSYDYELVSYKPYPHYTQGRFVFGSYSAKCPGAFNSDIVFIPKNPNQACLNGGGIAEIAIAPSIADIGIFVLSDVLLLSGAVNPDSLSGRLLFVGGMVAPWIDLAYGTNLIWSDTTDHAHFSEATGISRLKVFLAGNALVVLGAWRLYAQGKEVFYDKSKEIERQGMFLLPFSTRNSIGMTLSSQW